MKFSEMTYTRPDPAASKQRLSALTAELKAAKSYEEARKVFLSHANTAVHWTTVLSVVHRYPVLSMPRVRPDSSCCWVHTLH